MIKPKQLADDIKEALGFADQKTSKESIGFAKAIAEELQQNALVNFSTGTVQGITASGSPLIEGSAKNGAISGITGESLSGRIVANAGYPFVTSQVGGFSNAITLHLISQGKVVVAAGGIKGTTTNTGSNPGNLAFGYTSTGRITNLNPKAIAQIAASSLGGFTSKELIKFASVLVNHLEDFAEVRFDKGSVTGTAPAGGGPLAAGAATAGRIY